MRMMLGKKACIYVLGIIGCWNLTVLMAFELIGVVFQFARVGNDQEGAEFLRNLSEESPVSKLINTVSGGDLMDLIGARAADGRGYQARDIQQVCSS